MSDGYCIILYDDEYFDEKNAEFPTFHSITPGGRL